MTLRLLCDEHVGDPLVNRLESPFHLERVVEMDALGSGTEDADIWQYAVQEHLVVFTNDADFVDGSVVDDDNSHPGVIRYVGTDWDAIYRATVEIDRCLTIDQLRGHAFYVPGDWV